MFRMPTFQLYTPRRFIREILHFELKARQTYWSGPPICLYWNCRENVEIKTKS